LNGTSDLGGRLHIRGKLKTGSDAILKAAADAHAIFSAREPEFRLQALRGAMDESHLAELAEMAEEMDLDPDNFGYQTVADTLELMIINYFTDADEVSVYWEDDGLIGMDVTLSANLAFTRVEGGFDG